MLQKDQKERNSCFILQQIIDLKRLQLNEGTTNPSPLIHGQEQDSISSSMRHYAKKFNANLDENLTISMDTGSEIQQSDNSTSPLQGLKCDDEPFPFPFSQLENSPSSTVGLPLHGEPLWQNRSPAQSSQVSLANKLKHLLFKLN